MKSGRIVKFFRAKRFGFIAQDSRFKVLSSRDLTKDGFFDRVKSEIEMGFSVVVPGIRDEIPRELRRGRKEFEAFKQVHERLKGMFGTNYSVEKRNPFPSTLRPNSTHHIKHPSLEEICPYVYIVRKKDIFFQLEEDEIQSLSTDLNDLRVTFQIGEGRKGPEAYQIELLQDAPEHTEAFGRNSKELPVEFLRHIYDFMIEKDRNSWIVVGDETGDLNEFRGKNPENHAATMCWIAIPPNSNLPPLPPFFHVVDNKHYFEQAISSIANHQEVIMHQFRYKSGEEINDVPDASNQVHLIMWKDTLPLVLSEIAELCEEPTNVKIYIENVGHLSAGMPPLPGLLANWKKSMKQAWRNLIITEAKVLAKNPLEHPWLGYPDALGYLNTGRNWEDITLAKDVASLEQRTNLTPYRQNSLERVNRFFTAPHNPENFVKALFDFQQRDLEEYVKKFLGPLLTRHLQSFNQKNWRNLLEYMENNSESLQSQNAIHVIFEHCDFEQTLEMLTTDSYKFNFLMAALGSSNHSGDTKRSQTCKLLIDGLVESGFEPESHRKRHYNNLANGANDNEFDFELNMDDVGELLREFEEENALEMKINRKLAGAYAMTLALKGTEESLEIAWGLEEIIRDYAEASDPGGGDYARRLNLQAELLLAMENYEQARTHIETIIPEKVELDLLTLIETDGFLLAALMKACVLTNQGPSKYKVYSSFVTALLNHRHPSQRIAYWTARWAWQLGINDDAVAQHSTIHLLGLRQKPFFKKEAPGIILSCELLDLKHLGVIDADVEQFHSNVLAASTETTRQWVSAHPPTDEDWLAPLNFNYR